MADEPNHAAANTDVLSTSRQGEGGQAILNTACYTPSRAVHHKFQRFNLSTLYRTGQRHGLQVLFYAPPMFDKSASKFLSYGNHRIGFVGRARGREGCVNTVIKPKVCYLRDYRCSVLIKVLPTQECSARRRAGGRRAMLSLGKPSCEARGSPHLN